MKNPNPIIEEVRKYLNDLDQSASPDKLGGGRTNLWLRELLKEIDNLNSEKQS
jgi:hypothetical protein